MTGKNAFFEISDYCPKLNVVNTITGEYAVLFYDGKLIPKYKLKNCRCEYKIEHSCEYICPLLEKAINFRP